MSVTKLAILCDWPIEFDSTIEALDQPRGEGGDGKPSGGAIRRVASGALRPRLC